VPCGHINAITNALKRGHTAFGNCRHYFQHVARDARESVRACHVIAPLSPTA
jgi:hypothetical protein